MYLIFWLCIKSTQRKIILTLSHNFVIQISVRKSRKGFPKLKPSTIWTKLYKGIHIFMRKVWSTETWNLQIYSLQNSMISKLPISDLELRLRMLSSLVSIMWDLLCTWHLNLWRETNIPSKQIYGLWVSYFSKC